jgi:hypothetical protein
MRAKTLGLRICVIEFITHRAREAQHRLVSILLAPLIRVRAAPAVDDVF